MSPQLLQQHATSAGGAGVGTGTGTGTGAGAGVGTVVVVLLSAHQVEPQFCTHFSGPDIVQKLSGPKHVSAAQPGSWQHWPGPAYGVVDGVGGGVGGGGGGGGNGGIGPVMLMPSACTMA